MRRTEILVTRNGGDFEQKGREREENRWLLSLTLKERRFGMNKVFLGCRILWAFQLMDQKLKIKKKNKIAGMKDLNQSCSAKNISTCHHADSNKV